LHCLVATLARPVPVRQPVEFVVDERHKLDQRARFAVAPVLMQGGYVFPGVLHHEHPQPELQESLRLA
jgi:hypothetical protein